MVKVLKSLVSLALSMVLILSCSCDEGSGASDASVDTDTYPEFEDPQVDWVEIPAGSFTFGSPLSTPCRGAVTETEVDVTLTRPFLMSKYEVTQGQWKALDLEVPPNAPLCKECPVTFVNFYEAATWCNRLSELEGLEPCYRLEECTGSLNSGCPDGEFYEMGCEFVQGAQPPTPLPHLYKCPGDIRRYESMYDCDGYRLPTTAEWEYAAKDGTTTNTYNGDITVDSDGWCVDEPILNDIAWYCFNSGAGDVDASPDQIREVGEKQPNPFDLYDMLGNVSEWLDYRTTGGALNQDNPGEALTDPMGEPWSGIGDQFTDFSGGSFWDVSCYLRGAWRSGDRSFAHLAWVGFRPVRTLPATAPDGGAK